MNKDWIVRIYGHDDNMSEQTAHVVVRNRTEHEAEREVVNDVRDAADWTMMEITPRDELWLLLVPELIAIIKAQYHGNIEDYNVLDQGWDSLDVIEMIMDFEEKFHTEIGDALLEKIILEDRTPVVVCQEFVDRLTDPQVLALLQHIARQEQADTLEKAIHTSESKIDEAHNTIMELRETLTLKLEVKP